MTESSQEDRPPLVIARQGWFYVGGGYDEASEDAPFVDQMYVEFQIPQERRFAPPLVFVHGGQQTGTNWTGTPDGREGWAQFFLRRGHAVYVVDQVGRGRSAWRGDRQGPLAPLRRAFALDRFAAPERPVPWPQARLHTQWPGAAEPGDPAFDQFAASQAPSIADYAHQQRINAAALVALVEKIGPAILVVHSQAGAFAWIVADRAPDAVAAIVAVEPNGPPGRDVAFLGAPDWFADTGRVKISGLGDVPLTWDPPLAEGEALPLVRDDAPSAPECVTCWRQTEPPRRLVNLARTPVFMLTGEASYHAPYDHCTTAFLRAAGVQVDHVYLKDRGVTGNGHMLMIEKNSDAVAAVAADWIEAL
ncbi:MAG TPA: alpha/beta hydrolase [Beijerinckiaceae bacterium]